MKMSSVNMAAILSWPQCVYLSVSSRNYRMNEMLTYFEIAGNSLFH